MAKDQVTENAETTVFAITEDYAEKARKSVTVTPVAEAEGMTNAKVGFAEFTIEVSKFANDEGEKSLLAYRATLGDDVFEAEKLNALIKDVVTAVNGDEIDVVTKTRVTGYVVSDKGTFKSVGNSEPDPTLSDDDKEALNGIGERLEHAAAKAKKAESDGRESAFEQGLLLCEARSFLDATKMASSKSGKKLSKAEWGLFLETHYPEQASTKNGVGEHMTLGLFTSEYWEAAPKELASAKALQAWHNGNRAALAETIVHEIVIPAHLTKTIAAECRDVEGRGALADKILNDGDYKNAQEAVIASLTSQPIEGVNAVPFKALLAELDVADIGGYIKKAVVALIAKEGALTPEQEAKEKSAKAVAAVAVSFAEFTAQEAIEHIANILTVRDDFDDIAKGAVALIEQRDAEAEAQAEESDQEAEG